MQELQCLHPGCTNRHSAPSDENVMKTYDQMVAIGWFKSGSGWLCAQHGPRANPSAIGPSRQVSQVATTAKPSSYLNTSVIGPSRQTSKATPNRSANAPSPRPTVAKATPKRSDAGQWTVIILVVIAAIIVFAVVSSGASNASNKAYKAGFEVGFNSNNFVSNDQAGNYCQDLWNNLSGSVLSKYGSNEGNWVGGCTNGVKAAN